MKTEFEKEQRKAMKEYVDEKLKNAGFDFSSALSWFDNLKKTIRHGNVITMKQNQLEIYMNLLFWHQGDPLRYPFYASFRSMLKTECAYHAKHWGNDENEKSTALYVLHGTPPRLFLLHVVINTEGNRYFSVFDQTFDKVKLAPRTYTGRLEIKLDQTELF